jgi:cell division protein FtsA
MGQVIAALDLGTSKSVVLVAQKEHSDKYSVLHTETLFSEHAIRRGRVYNTEDASEMISKFIRKINIQLHSSPLEKIYVGIGGQSLRSEPFNVTKTVDSGTINQQLLDAMKEEANRHIPEFEENYGVVSSEYFADGVLVSKPKGIQASVVEVRFQLIVGNPCLKRNLEAAIKEKGISVAGYLVSPVATAEGILTQEEKESGCALIEFGEGVTYVSVYKNGLLRHLVTLPIGGLAITKDIRSLNVSEEEAEALKIKYGSALSLSSDNNDVPVNEGENPSRKIELRSLNWVIEARVNEIVQNVWSQIQSSGYSQAIDAGIVITGGGALLRDLPLFIRNQTGKEVRLAIANIWINQVETQLSPANSCVFGLVSMGKEHCLKTRVSLFSGLDKNNQDRVKEKIEQQEIEKRRIRDIEKAERDRKAIEQQQERKKKQEEAEKARENKKARFTSKLNNLLYKSLDIFKDEDYMDDADTANNQKNNQHAETQQTDKDSENNKNE